MLLYLGIGIVCFVFGVIIVMLSTLPYREKKRYQFSGMIKEEKEIEEIEKLKEEENKLKYAEGEVEYYSSQNYK